MFDLINISISYSESRVPSYDQLFSWPPLGSTYDHPTSTHQQFVARAFTRGSSICKKTRQPGIPSCLKGSVARARVSYRKVTCSHFDDFWWPFQSSSSWCSHFDPFLSIFHASRLSPQVLWPLGHVLTGVRDTWSFQIFQLLWLWPWALWRWCRKCIVWSAGGWGGGRWESETHPKFVLLLDRTSGWK